MRSVRITAVILSLAWAGWWVFFGLASGQGEGMRPAGVLIHAAVPGLVFLVSAVFAWRCEPAGGVALIAEGLLVSFLYPVAFRHAEPETIAFVLLTMAVPPLIAGFLYLTAWWRCRASSFPAGSAGTSAQ